MACVLCQCPKLGQNTVRAFIFLPFVQTASNGTLRKIERGWNAFGGPKFSLTVTYNGQFAVACRTLVSREHLYKTYDFILKSKKGDKSTCTRTSYQKEHTATRCHALHQIHVEHRLQSCYVCSGAAKEAYP